VQLTSFDIDAFLRDSWQKAPLLIRNAWDAWCNPLEPDELAGLACEPGVESRLVTQSSDQWELEHGPLPASRFRDIDKKPWTLLVQAVDHHVPAVAALLEPFRFIPSWRVDDVMVSYAADGGGVGAHFDQYDVVLVQGLGHRRWQIGAQCNRATELLAHDDLRLLASFEPIAEWVLGPGDMLYLPPGVAHNGIAVGDDCMTYSIGFRAPSRSELIAGWAEFLAGELDDGDRYGDAGLAAQANPGEISHQAVARLQEMVAERVLDSEAFAHWFGEYSTAPKSREIDWRPDQAIGLDEIRARITEGSPLLCNPASRFSFIRGDAGVLTLFIDGRTYRCAGPTASLAEQLCPGRSLALGRDALESSESLGLILDLVNQGSMAFELPD
jgi:50S ribosomal protein L16 3-hydroxylase